MTAVSSGSGQQHRFHVFWPGQLYVVSNGSQPGQLVRGVHASLACWAWAACSRNTTTPTSSSSTTRQRLIASKSTGAIVGWRRIAIPGFLDAGRAALRARRDLHLRLVLVCEWILARPPRLGLYAGTRHHRYRATNNLTGLLLGTDMWICLLPGLRAGGEVQAGVYGNPHDINTTIGSNLPNTPDFLERLEANDVAFIGQINLLTTYRITINGLCAAAISFLFVDGVAWRRRTSTGLAVPQQPFTPREQITNDNGNVFYHGWNVGLEFMW